MTDLLVPFYALGPALFGYALAYLLRRPDEWIGPAIVLLFSALLTVLTHRCGYRKFEQHATVMRLEPRLSRYGGLCVGLVLFVTGYFWLVD